MNSCRRWKQTSALRSTRALVSVFVACAGSVAIDVKATAATAQVNGQAAVVGEFLSNVPPKGSEYKGVRVPLGLLLEGRASSNVSVYLDLRFNANQYPQVAAPLGNVEDTTLAGNGTAKDVNHPFTRDGGRGEKREVLRVGQAFVRYESNDAGEFTAGRIPRRWGLGLWLDDEWKPEGGTQSTADAISYKIDFPSGLIATAFWEKVSEGSLSSRSDDADALTGQIQIKDELTDGNSSGVNRELGLAFSKYDHSASSTEMKIFDIYGKFSLGRIGLEAELNWPTGKTRSLKFGNEGGDIVSADGTSFSRESQSIDGLNVLLRTRYQLSGGVSVGESESKISQTDAARLRRPTSQVAESQILGLSAGYSRGDVDAFDRVVVKNSKITGISMHPNVRPAFLMFNPLSADTAGMPGAVVRNVLFARAEYSFESPNFGMLTPAVIFARLDQVNSKATGTDIIGRNRNVGFEVDINYSYRTVDGVRFSVDGGLWVPGGAWESSGVKPETVYGVRATAATFF